MWENQVFIYVNVLKHIGSVHHIIGTLQGVFSHFGISHKPGKAGQRNKMWDIKVK